MENLNMHDTLLCMILYPTETVYGLGVNGLDSEAIKLLYVLKGRKDNNPVSWLVRNKSDIEKYAVVDDIAAKLIDTFLPGSMTLVLKSLNSVSDDVLASDRFVRFRISPDPVAQSLVEELGYPLTCTSANVSGLPTLETPREILEQFGDRASMIERVLDDGPRSGIPSTVVRVEDGNVEICREGAISAEEILSVVG